MLLIHPPLYPEQDSSSAAEDQLWSLQAVLIYSPLEPFHVFMEFLFGFMACETLLGIEIEQWHRIRFAAAC